ncbi:MAG TPA: peroxide stress protein YaaA [Hyphomonadaceae bacterium]|nr:peroxide stress protein YaaA [Hyphomonadaceae bacterium]
MIWPRHGVYFFFEPGESRSGSGSGHRVVRVGTHALKVGSGSTLWGRLAQHRGAISGGNHRGSVFRQLVGLAIANRHPELHVSTWGSGTSAPPQVTEQERELEARVSAVLAKMQVLWLAVGDEPGPQSLRGFIERNSIALLSSYRHPAIDPASPDWLGYRCPRERVTKSGLWNSNHVGEVVDPTFLDVLEQLVESGAPLPVSGEAKHQTTVDGRRVRTGGNADLIIAALQRWSDLDDDELAQRAGVSPRQQVNIVCRRLEQRGLLKRLIGSRGKIVNRLTGIHQPGTSAIPSGPPSLPTKSAPVAVKAISTRANPAISLASASPDTLIILPCSGRKADGSESSDDGGTLLAELPDILASRLSAARRAVAGIAHLDESTLMPAWHRYNGTLYQTARLALELSRDTCLLQHILILSGAYGIVRAVDPIGTYDLAMEENRWPPGLLQEVIETYARRLNIHHVLAVVSETTGYARILRKVAWRRAGVSDALLLTPEASTGAMVKAPRAIGEALVTMMAGGFDPSWRSSDGLQMFAQQLA